MENCHEVYCFAIEIGAGLPVSEGQNLTFKTLKTVNSIQPSVMVFLWRICRKEWLGFFVTLRFIVSSHFNPLCYKSEAWFQLVPQGGIYSISFLFFAGAILPSSLASNSLTLQADGDRDMYALRSKCSFP